MSKYFVYDGAPQTGTGTRVLVGQGFFVIDLNTPSGFLVGDVIQYGDFYGVIESINLTDQVRVGYDDRIFQGTVPASAAYYIYEKAAGPAEGVSTNVIHTYSISHEITQARYSDYHIPYNTSEKWYVTIDNFRRSYLGDFQSLIKKYPLFLVDDCSNVYGVAYKIASESDAFDIFNNSFKRNVKFRVIEK